MAEPSIRFDSSTLRQDRLEELIEWIGSLGIAAKDVRPQAVILMGEQSYQLHLSKFVRSEAGRVWLDQASQTVVTVPLVVDLGATPCWPKWLEATDG
jgi:hypothetical protein